MNGRTNENNNNSEDDVEAQLLAAHGATTASASIYEESVLRDAKLRSAPQISLPHSTIANNAMNHSSLSKLVPIGEERPALPDLSSLGPSTAAASMQRKGAAAADVPHVLKVLSRTRNLLQSTLSKNTDTANMDDPSRKREEIDKLRLKEELLLEYLTKVAGLNEDDAMIPQSKVGGRKRRRTSSGGTGNASDDYYGTATNDDEDILGDALGVGESSTKIKRKRSSSEKIRGKTVDSSNDIQSMSSTNRLDRIKNGEQFHSTTSSTQKLKRTTMMSMKSQMRIDNGMKPLKTMEEEKFDAEKSKKRREERRKRRLKRQRAALGIESSSDEEAEFDSDKKPKAKKKVSAGILKKKKKGEDVEEEKKTHDTEGESKDDKQSKQAAGVQWAADTDTGIKTTESDDKKEERTYTKVFCPICSVILTVDKSEDGSPDEFLAKHITECQTTSRSRNGGRTLRKRKKPSVIDEMEVDDCGGSETETFAPEKVADDDDGDELLGEYDDEAQAQPPSKRPPPTSIDDVDEFDYEDRVDDWIENGLDNMNVMSERDSSEVPPGSVVYEGGLEIPAWINNRLFPYQRIGVRWMWELHCQGAGGVVSRVLSLLFLCV